MNVKGKPDVAINMRMGEGNVKAMVEFLKDRVNVDYHDIVKYVLMTSVLFLLLQRVI